MSKKFYTEEKIKYLRGIAPGTFRKEIWKKFNRKFNCNKSFSSIKNILNKFKISNGITDAGQFKKGSIPWNKGVKGVCKSNSGSFKKGSIPWNKKLIGSERTNVEGYVEVKVAEPNKWKLKQRIIYEKIYGKIPKGNLIIFADGNKQNFELNNLICVTKAENVRLNQDKFKNIDGDLTKTRLNLVRLSELGRKRKRGEKNAQKRRHTKDD